MSELSRTLMEIKRLRKQLRKIEPELRECERAIAEDEDLTSEQKKIKTRQVREQFRARQQKLHDEKSKVCGKADRLQAETVTEGGTRIAHERARQLLREGASLDAVIARAEEADDSDTLRAVMAEAQYVAVEDGSLADARGVVQSCIDALARMGRNDAETLRAIQETRRPLDKIAEFAAKSVHTGVTGIDRISLAYALGPEEDSNA